MINLKLSKEGAILSIAILPLPVAAYIVQIAESFPKLIDYFISFIRNIDTTERAIIWLLLLCSCLLLLLIHQNFYKYYEKKRHKRFSAFFKSSTILLTLIVFITSSCLFLMADKEILSKKRNSPLDIRIISDETNLSYLTEIQKYLSETSKKIHEDSKVVFMPSINSELQLEKEINNTMDADIVIFDTKYLASLLIDKPSTIRNSSNATLFLTLKTVAEESLKKNKNLISVAPAIKDYLSFIAIKIQDARPENNILISVKDDGFSQFLLNMLTLDSFLFKNFNFKVLDTKQDLSSEIEGGNSIIIKLHDENLNFSKVAEKIEFYKLNVKEKSISPFFKRNLILDKSPTLPLQKIILPEDIHITVPVLFEAVMDPDVGLNNKFYDNFFLKLEKYNIIVESSGQLHSFYKGIF